MDERTKVVKKKSRDEVVKISRNKSEANGKRSHVWALKGGEHWF